MINIILVALFSLTGFSQDLGKFQNSWYYLPSEDDYSTYPKTTNILDKKGKVIARVSAAFKKALTLEGSGKLSNGSVVNYSGVVNGQIRFNIVKAQFGLGVKNCELEPLHSVAVDPKVIPLGSKIRIKETIGLRFPDGTLHDGIWFAVDVGGAIHGKRIDLFMGAGKENGFFLEKSGIDFLDPVSVELVSKADKSSCVFK